VVSHGAMVEPLPNVVASALRIDICRIDPV